MVFLDFGAHASGSSFGSYSNNALPCLERLPPKSCTCSLGVGTDEHLDNSDLASPQVASHLETSHTSSFHHLFLGNKESTSPTL